MLTDAQRAILSRPARKLQLITSAVLASQALFWTIAFVAVVYFEVPVQISGLAFLEPFMPYISFGIGCVALVTAARVPQTIRRHQQTAAAKGEPLESLFIDKNELASAEFQPLALPAAEYEATRIGWLTVLSVGMGFNLIDYLVHWKPMNLAMAVILGVTMFILLVLMFPTRSRWEQAIERATRNGKAP